MSLVAAAVLPHPPLLVPEVAAGAAGELDGLRSACDQALAEVLGAGPDLVVLVGAGPRRLTAAAGDWGSLEGFGVPVRVALGSAPGPGPAVLPLSLTIGAWLLGRTRWSGPVRAVAVAEEGDSCAPAGVVTDPEGTARRVALLVLGDASARRTAGAPGGFDPRAEPFDAAVARALEQADTRALAELPAGLAAELLVAGRLPWVLLARAVQEDARATGRRWQGQLLAHEAPYGVGYLVACWSPDGRDPEPLESGPAALRPAGPLTGRATGRTTGRATGCPGDQAAGHHRGPGADGPRVVAVVGPTAAGKSALAVELARELGGEVVNADAMALYRGMDIGTGKPTVEQRRGVVHHLFDLWDVRERASVAAYQQRARRTIEELVAAGRPAVVVGGSGLYVQAALDQLSFPGTDPELRARWERRLAEVGPAGLHAELARRDPAAAAAILPSNGRRLVRALEVVELTGSYQARLPAPRSVWPGTVLLGLDPPLAELDRRIATRVAAMFEAGLVAEVRRLEAAGLREGVTASRALGYRQVLEGEEGASERTVLATRRFARRQRSWFHRDPRVIWVADLAQARAALGRHQRCSAAPGAIAPGL